MGDTLALVNVARQAIGYEPLTDLPRAKPGDSSECLYARALKDIGAVSVGGSGSIRFASERIAQRVASLWGTQAEGATVNVVPHQFGQVIGRFDNGELPNHSVR